MLQTMILRFIRWFFTSKDIVMSSNEDYVMHAVQLIQLHNVFTSNLHLFMPHSYMYVFPCYLLQHHQCRVLYYFL
jgi:hypothetical protein